MSQYSKGTAIVTNGSATVTGTNTLWLASVSAADSFTIAGDGVMYDVASVDSDTQVTLSAPYAGTTASGVVYAIGTGFTVPDSFPEMSQGDIETATVFTRAMRKIQGKFSALVSDISGKADISGQVFTGDIAAPKITASTGILFGTDTAASNTLDDYETGTWDPNISSLSNITGTLSSSGTYIKVGGLVYIEISVSGGSITSAGVETRFSYALPFTAYSPNHASVGSASLIVGSGNNRFSYGAAVSGTTNSNKANCYLAGREIENTGAIQFIRVTLQYKAL